MSRVGEKIKEARLKAGMTQKDLFCSLPQQAQPKALHKPNLCRKYPQCEYTLVYPADCRVFREKFSFGQVRGENRMSAVNVFFQ